MTQTTIQEIEQNIADAKQVIEFETALERLQGNRDFQKIITDGYLKNEAVRLVHLKASVHMQSPERQAAIERDINGIGSLLQYFQTIAFNANQARKAISAGEEAIDEINNGEAE